MCTYIQFDVYLAALQVASYPQYGLSSSSPASGMNHWATLTELHILIDSVFDTILLWILKATAHWWIDSLRNIDRNAYTDRFSVWHNFTSQGKDISLNMPKIQAPLHRDLSGFVIISCMKISCSSQITNIMINWLHFSTFLQSFLNKRSCWPGMFFQSLWKNLSFLVPCPLFHC